MGLKSWLNRITKDSIDGLVPVTEIMPVAEPVVKPEVEKKPRKPRKPKVVKPVDPINAEKEAATLKGEPWVTVVGLNIDMDNPSDGSMSLDWNDLFIAKLIRAGYVGKTDADLVDQWFSSICRNVLAENFEQSMADPTNRNR